MFLFNKINKQDDSFSDVKEDDTLKENKNYKFNDELFDEILNPYTDEIENLPNFFDNYRKVLYMLMKYDSSLYMRLFSLENCYIDDYK